MPLLKINKTIIYKHCLSILISSVMSTPLHHIMPLKGNIPLLRSVDIIGLSSHPICLRILLRLGYTVDKRLEIPGLEALQQESIIL